MSSRISNLLEQQSQPGLHAFGAEVAMLEQNGMHSEARDAAYNLSRAVEDLLHSNHPSDIESIPYINSNFDEYDLIAAHEALKDKLRKPLGHTVLKWLSDAPTGDVVTFSVWNSERQQAFQRQLNQDQKPLQADTITRVKQLINIGLYPKNATSLYLGAMERYGKFKAMDSFESGGVIADGYCDEATIALANRYEKPDILKSPGYIMKEINFHEYTHGAGRHRGFLYGLYTNHHYLHLLEEAFVTHATSVAMAESNEDDPLDYHMPHVIHPGERIADLGRYQPERELLDMIARGDDEGPIPIDFMAETYFSPFDTKGGIDRRKELERRLGKYFGGIERFYALCDAYTQEPHQKERTELLNTAMHDLQEVPLYDDLVYEDVPMAGPPPYAIIDRGAIARF